MGFIFIILLYTVLNNFSLKIFALTISKTRANLKKLSAYSGSATSIYPKIDLTLRAKFFMLTSDGRDVNCMEIEEFIFGDNLRKRICLLLLQVFLIF